MNNEPLRPRVLDTRSGQEFYVDTDAARLTRLWRRASAWHTALSVDLLQRLDLRLKMITLTYRPSADGLTAWRPNHIRDFMKKVRRNLETGLLAYAWVAELQQRGEVHYHVLLLVKRGTSIPYPDAEWWPHGSTRIESARNPYYIMKYTSKGGFTAPDGTWKIFPRGLRLFAVWISADLLSAMERFNFKLAALPKWLSEILEENGLIVKVGRCEGGGWTITGDVGPPVHLASPFKLVSLYG
jgi:hypothetical protein